MNGDDENLERKGDIFDMEQLTMNNQRQRQGSRKFLMRVSLSTQANKELYVVRAATNVSDLYH